MGDGPPQTAQHGVPTELLGLLNAKTEDELNPALEVFLLAFHKLILFAVRSTEGDHDLVMDRYAYVLEHLSEGGFRRLRAFEVDVKAKFSTWLVVVTRRLVIDHQRRHYGRGVDPEGQGSPERQAERRRLADLVSSAIDVSQLADPQSPDPDRDLQREEMRGAFSSVLASLSPRDQLLLSFRYQDEMPARQIAEIMGFPSPFHVYRKLKKVLGNLRAELRLRGIEESDV